MLMAAACTPVVAMGEEKTDLWPSHDGSQLAKDGSQNRNERSFVNCEDFYDRESS